MDTISFPVKFEATGLKMLRSGSTGYYSQLLSFAILTEPNRHPLTPDFGIFDPAFRLVDKGLFVTQAARYVPEVVITKVDVELSETEELAVHVGFEERK